MTKAQKPSIPKAVKKMLAIADQQTAIANPDEYNVHEMNELHAVVLNGSDAVIIRFDKSQTPDRQLSFLREKGFRLFYHNKFVERADTDGRKKSITWAQAWLSDPQRKTYQGMTFLPDPEIDIAPKNHLNLWRGFSVTPQRGGSYQIFKDHLFNNVANSDPDLFNWILAWFAQMLQKPREKPGTAIVLRGSMGTGKTKVGEVVGSLIASNYYPVSDPRHVTGHFNAFMAQCLLLQAEEAFWAGDKGAEGRLKDLITSDSHMIEAKGVDPIKMPNYLRLLITSNEDWVVPAGRDERRFCVVDVNPRCARNFDYFKEMDEELNNGGREALLYDLLRLDISEINLREIPKTNALLEQKTRSLDGFMLWLLERLKAGAPTAKHDTWPEYVSSADLFHDYIETCDLVGQNRKTHETIFGINLKKILPNCIKKRRTVPRDTMASTQRIWVIELPPLHRCRDAFEDVLGQPMEWEDAA